MATRKASSTAKKTKKSPSVSKSTTATVTTVKAVDSKPAEVTAVAKPAKKLSKLTFSNSVSLTALLAEFIGTFILTAVFILMKGEPLYLGFSVIAIVLIIGTLSGAHINPLNTIGAWVTRKMTSLQAGGYVIAQILGAVAALGLLTAFIGGAPQPEAGGQAAMMGSAPQAQTLFTIAELTSGKEWFVFFAELTGATVLAFAVATALREKRDRVAAAMTVGFGLFTAGLIAGVTASYVGAHAVINPAIALTVGAIDWGKINFMAISIYMIAPLIGGVIGFALSDALRVGRDKDEV